MSGKMSGLGVLAVGDSSSPDKTFKCSTGWSVEVIVPARLDQAVTSRVVPGTCIEDEFVLLGRKSVSYISI